MKRKNKQEVISSAEYRKKFCNVQNNGGSVMAKPGYGIYIGIDAGTNTGFAVYDAKTKHLIQVDTLMIHEAMDAVLRISKADKTKVIVEDARQRTWFGKNSKDKLQGAGSVKRDCTIWEDYLTAHEIDFEMVHPKKSITKLNQQQFATMTGYTKRTSEHGRDAGMLVHGK